ncbi:MULTISPECIES: lysophospholipid acyltransferase family protein [Mammaliicoccus]|uniref:1-acyl-sn-glycerol-3-phosphate acyltransferase n=1 Tax=Mammaliicoccus fleurettii TaxID=150056 RepID=A0ABS5MMS1_9STAP|nr:MULTISPECIES: lysophospholipid acyltransferase family protein [Mammaliicoccus]HCN61130.1 1-acyl-sn-glycerol-3-phosphate acyltransferase [Staphylococcus sp.]MBL0846753.1 1-acyl-sn-glycerol-3-phosphate acyltransferase [Mammaliicoccus fleurettii]MBO3061895.1 1-acyl-sn-glycerol-3-phosphate acyltransferase [Mammaliicoccus fleurettii]MBS3672309.1 1-acyl-sn-glycerol-3-phosphate acyltransferase [Mammaliicoccus fleurettii]MBS3697215.1 1-acyl-sn-glycerol-3-phosphate acyltransferase [Mammaliicoccus fl
MLRLIIFTMIIKPIILIVLGLNIRRREWLPKEGPIVIIANHNSHLDTLVLLSLFQGKGFKKARPVAAGDYFFKNKLLKWFSINIMQIIPIERKMTRDIKGLFEPIVTALDEGSIIILYPEGSRGEPEKLSKYKSGIYYLMRERPDIPIQPLFLHGLGKSLPKGSKLFVPFFVDIFVGQSFLFNKNRKEFMDELNSRMNDLRNEGDFKEW